MSSSRKPKSKAKSKAKAAKSSSNSKPPPPRRRTDSDEEREEEAAERDDPRDTRNVTQVVLTCNSNLSEARYSYSAFASEMFDLCTHLFESEAAQSEVFGDTEVVELVDANGPHVEVGGKLHRLHFNLEVELRHQLQLYSLPKLAKRMREHLNREWPESKGWHVWVNLVDRRMSNYANKEGRWEENDRAAGAFDEELLARLTLDDREVVEQTNGEGKTRRYTR